MKLTQKDPHALAALEQPTLAHPQATHRIRLNGQLLAYQLVRSSRRTVGFMVGADGLRVRASSRVSLAEIDARKRAIDIDIKLPSDLPKVLADPILIEQVLLNLIKNGLEAMDKSTENVLTIEVSRHHNTMQVAVIDTGHGVSDPHRLFEPFFSTKSEGLGMGLNICRTIIESHHGQLWASNNQTASNPDQTGTTFRFTLPCAPIEMPSDGNSATDPAPDHKTTEEFSV